MAFTARADGGIVADVGGERQAFRAQGAALLGERFELVGRAHRVAGIGQRPGDVQGRDPDPLAGHGQGRRPPLPVRRSRDEGNLPGQLRGRCGRTPFRCRHAHSSRLRYPMQVIIQVDPQRVVEQVRGDHEAAERRQRDDLLGPEPGGEPGEQLVGDAVRILRQLPAVVDDGLLPVVQLERLGVLARVDQEPPEEGRADQAIRAGRDGMREERGRPLAQERHDCFAEVVPGHQRVQRDRRAGQRALHVRDPAVRREDLVQRGAAGRIGFVILKRWDSCHERLSL